MRAKHEKVDVERARSCQESRPLVMAQNARCPEMVGFILRGLIIAELAFPVASGALWLLG